MRLPNTAHTSRPWRVHEFTRDFELEDVWALPTPGGRDDLARLVRQTVSPSDGSEFPTVFRALFALRWKLGELFGWDKADSGVGERVRSLRERLPADLLEGPRGPDLRAVPGRTEVDGPPVFASVYQTRDEWVAELSNKTVHSLMHLGWVPDDSGGGYHAQMAVLVKPNGWLGKAYMAAIKPFRYALVYPMLLRSIGRQWRAPDRVRRVGVTDPIAAARRYDYADAFELRLEGPDLRSPEEWVRAGVAATPAWIKRIAGARDGLGSARIVESDAEVVVLEDSDPLMDTVMVGRNVEPERRVLTTVLRYRRPLLARAVWAFVGILHRRTAKQVVTGGLERSLPREVPGSKEESTTMTNSKPPAEPATRRTYRFTVDIEATLASGPGEGSAGPSWSWDEAVRHHGDLVGRLLGRPELLEGLLRSSAIEALGRAREQLRTERGWGRTPEQDILDEAMEGMTEDARAYFEEELEDGASAYLFDGYGADVVRVAISEMRPEPSG